MKGGGLEEEGGEEDLQRKNEEEPDKVDRCRRRLYGQLIRRNRSIRFSLGSDLAVGIFFLV